MNLALCENSESKDASYFISVRKSFSDQYTPLASKIRHTYRPLLLYVIQNIGDHFTAQISMLLLKNEIGSKIKKIVKKINEKEKNK